MTDAGSSKDESERWEPIPGHKGYEASNMGRIRSRRKVLRPSVFGGKGPRGRLGVRMNGSLVKVHRAVLLAFVGPSPAGYHGAHLDGDRFNNRLSNLAWVTPSENEIHKRAHGTSLQGLGHHQARLTEAEVYAIRRLFDARLLLTREIAVQFNISQTAVMKIGQRKTWPHLPEGVQESSRGGSVEP